MRSAGRATPEPASGMPRSTSVPVSNLSSSTNKKALVEWAPLPYSRAG